MTGRSSEGIEKSETYRFAVGEDGQGGRLDKVLAALCEDLSRSRIQDLIRGGQVSVNGEVCTDLSRKLRTGDRVEMDVPPPQPCAPEPENIPLDIVYEDGDLIVMNKQAGLVVHPGAGNWSGTLVNALLHHCGDDLSGIGGVLRPGIVHRLDKDTTGLMVVAKNDAAHQGLAGQLADRSLSRVYQALALGVPVPPKGGIDQPIGRHPSNRLKMAVTRQGRPAKTHYKTLKTYHEAFSLLECRLESGRTHQIRVHMAHAGYPLIGDPLYGPQKTAVQAALKKHNYNNEISNFVLNFPRQALHAAEIAFVHPVKNEPMTYSAPLPEDLSKLLKYIG